MSLIHMSGFEGAPKNRENNTGGCTYVTGGRTGRALQITGGNNVMTLGLDTALNEIMFGVAVKPLNGIDLSQNPRIILNSVEGEEINITFGANYSLTVVRMNQWGNVNIITIPGVVEIEKWNYYEFHFKSHPTTGIAKVWVNGTLSGNFTGDTTRNDNATDPKQFTSIALCGPGAGWAGNILYDDFYVIDPTVDGTATQGRPFQSVLGMPKIEPLTIVGSGSVNEWVGSDGNSVDNHLLVDEMPPSETDYVESSTTGQRELYDFTAPVLSGQILAVDVNAYAASPDGGINPVKTLRRSSAGTVDVGSGKTPATTYRNWSDGAKAKDPDGNFWTKASVDAATFGVEVG